MPEFLSKLDNLILKLLQDMFQAEETIWALFLHLMNKTRVGIEISKPTKDKIWAAYKYQISARTLVQPHLIPSIASWTRSL